LPPAQYSSDKSEGTVPHQPGLVPTNPSILSYTAEEPMTVIDRTGFVFTSRDAGANLPPAQYTSDKPEGTVPYNQPGLVPTNPSILPYTAAEPMTEQHFESPGFNSLKRLQTPRSVADVPPSKHRKISGNDDISSNFVANPEHPSASPPAVSPPHNGQTKTTDIILKAFVKTQYDIAKLDYETARSYVNLTEIGKWRFLSVTGHEQMLHKLVVTCIAEGGESYLNIKPAETATQCKHHNITNQIEFYEDAVIRFNIIPIPANKLTPERKKAKQRKQVKHKLRFDFTNKQQETIRHEITDIQFQGHKFESSNKRKEIYRSENNMLQISLDFQERTATETIRKVSGNLQKPNI